MSYTEAVNQDDIPLFPLNAVLFPGGTLSLRIFEPRYLDLVRDCTRSNSGFGVCLILAGREAGEPATPAAVGTLAHIEDFYSLPDGLLGIRARGSRRFRAARSLGLKRLQQAVVRDRHRCVGGKLAVGVGA